MSKGRSRHQASRRRTYSARQRDLRERRVNAVSGERDWLSDRGLAIEVEESLDFDTPTSFNVAPRDRATAA
jgi:hypothetical protein